MFAWCAYCQRFTGERAPFDDFGLTHGVCERCHDRTTSPSDAEIAAMRAIAEFHHEVLANALTGSDLDDVVRRGRALGLGPLELLVGILQPALYEVGRAWAAGTISHAIEAKLSKECERVMAELEGDAPVGDGATRYVLMAAHFNRHTLGLRMAALRLRASGRDVRVLSPTPALDRLRDVLAALVPAIVGVSVATEWQLGFVRELAAIVGTLSPRPRLVAGGLVIRAGVDLPAGVERWTDP